MLLALMLLSMIAAAAGIYFLVPVRTTIVGALKFSNFDELTEYDRLAIVRQQEDLLKNPDLRTLSQNLFKRNHPQADPGFLADPVSFGQTVAGGATWPNDGDMLAIRYVGSDPDAQADVQRVAALMSALYSKNSALVDVRNRVQAQVDGLQRAIAKTQGEVSRLESERDRLKPLFDARPSAAKLAEVQEQLDQRKKVWNAAVTAVTHLKVEVEALRRAAGVETPAATTQPTAAAAAAPTTLPSVAAQSAVAGEVDPQIAELQESLDDAATKLAAQKKADADKARQARQDLDAALEEFQQQIAAAKGSLENNPELQAYLDEAQSLQQAMRKLTIELIDRQQEQHTRLTELKQRLDEKLQERRSNAWQNDPQLREFGERLAMTRRAHNAALAEGLNDEAKDLEAKVKLLEEMIKSRQELVGQDTLVSDTIQQLEEMIASTEKQLADDRKSSEEMMDRLQKSFAQNQASKLPAEQQALAADLEKRIADMNAARAQYASALGDSTTGSVDARQLEAVVSDLRSKIEIRAAELERQQNEQAVSDGQQNARQGGLESRQAELAAAEESEAKAQAAYFEVHNEYQDLQASLAQARSAGEKLDETIHDLAVARDQLTRQQDQLQAKTSELARAAAPMAPGENDVRVSDRQDLRSTIILASWGGIAVLFVIMISLTSASSSSSSSASEVPLAAIAPSARDDNGEAGGHHEGDAEESAADNIIDDDDDRSPASSNGHANGDAPDEHHTESAEVARF